MNFSIIFNDLFLKKKKLFLSSTGVGSRFLIKNIKQQKIFPKSKFKYFALEFCVLNLIVEREKFNKNINIKMKASSMKRVLKFYFGGLNIFLRGSIVYVWKFSKFISRI